jgi:hypothetical protein
MTMQKMNKFAPLTERLRAMAAAAESRETAPMYSDIRMILREAAARLEAAEQRNPGLEVLAASVEADRASRDDASGSYMVTGRVDAEALKALKLL